MRKKKTTAIQNTSQIQLGGNVLIEVRQGKRAIKKMQIHNTGTLNLFRGIAFSLCSNSQANLLPNFICAGTGKIGSNNPVTLTGLISPLNMIMESIKPINAPQIVNSTQSRITFEAFLPYSSIGSTTPIWELGIYGNSTSYNNSMVARVEFPSAISLNKGQSLYIQWTFSIENVSSN